MKAKTVRETLNEVRIPGYSEDEVRFSNIPADLSKTYNMRDGRILSRKTTKEMKKEQNIIKY